MLAGKDTVFEGSVLTQVQNELGLSGNSRPGPSLTSPPLPSLPPEAESVQAVRDDLDELRRRMEEQAASHVAALQRQAAEAAAPRATTASVASLFEKIGRLSAEEMKRVVQVGQGLA